MIPVTGVLLLLQGIAEIIRCILCIREGAWPQRLHDVEETESVIIQEQQHPARARTTIAAAAGPQGDWSMTDPQVGMLMLGLFIFIIMLGFPIAFTLMAMGVGFGFYAYYMPGQEFFENRIFTLLVQKTFEVTSSDVLTAVPLFLFMGYLVERANILDRLFHSLQLSMKNVPGALAVATLITCAMFATATGIVGAVVTLMGLLAFPGHAARRLRRQALGRRGVRRRLPRHPDPAEHPADRLCGDRRRLRGQALCGRLHSGLPAGRPLRRLRDRAGDASIRRSAPKLPKEQTDVPLRQGACGRCSTSFLPLALLIVSVLGAILFGLATPSEAAGVGALGEHRAGRRLRGAQLRRCSRNSVYLTARATAMVCYLFIGSWTFSSVFAVLGGQAVVEQFFLVAQPVADQFLLLTQVIIFLLGWPLEWTEIIIIFVPIFLPLLDDFGIDPIFFGILVALNTQTAFNTPPVAMAAFYLKGVAPPHVKLTDIFSGALPFVFMVFITMALVYIFPQIALWLPDYLYTPR